MMLGPIDYSMWSADFLVEICCVVCLLKKRAFTGYFTLVLYLCSSIAVGVGRYSILGTSGFNSGAYYYFYFYSDALLTISLYFILMSLYAHVFSEMGVTKLLRGGAMLLLAGTVWISYHMVAASSDRFVTQFVIELSQNVYFSAFAGSYALDNIYQGAVVWRYVFHLMAMWLPISWAYTFMKVPEDARMATARVLVPNR